MGDGETGGVRYPVDAGSYRLLYKIGAGVSAVVYKAVCLPLDSAVVAIKAVDLERSRANLDDMWREAKAMALLSHPNVLRAHCSFTVGTHLWVVMPFMAAGSLHSILCSGFPDGLPEPCIAVILKETLCALSYLHGQGRIHRDIKAGNILVDSDGSVKLADFGVSASIYEYPPSSSSFSGSLHTPTAVSCSSYFNEMAGTPYWMAPEVIHSHVGYGVKADIWSFGITALELAHGRPPFSHLPPSKSLLMRITSRLRLEDASHDDGVNDDTKNSKRKKKKFSKAFKDMVTLCLCQEPAKRPSADKFLRHPFFKNCRSTDYLVKSVLQAVPNIEERYENINMCECINGTRCVSPCHDANDSRNRRISGWNFNEEGFNLDQLLPYPETERSERCSVIESGSRDRIVIAVQERDEEETRKSQEEVLAGPAQETETIVDLKETMVPHLVSILGSLEMQRVMVMHVLDCCANGVMNSCDDEMRAREQSEQLLLSYVRQLQQRVQELSLQVQEEIARNVQLEEVLRERIKEHQQ